MHVFTVVKGNLIHEASIGGQKVQLYAKVSSISAS